jgi:hypothetical protein
MLLSAKLPPYVFCPCMVGWDVAKVAGSKKQGSNNFFHCYFLTENDPIYWI